MPKLFVTTKKTVIQEIIGGDGPNPSDLFSLRVVATDTNVAPADAPTFTFGVALIDASSAPADAGIFNLQFPADTSPAPDDASTTAVRYWLSGSTGTAGNVTNPTNADGQFVIGAPTNAVCRTVPAGAAAATLTSACGAAIGAVTFTTAVYRGWYRLQTTLGTSTAKVVLHSTTAAFADVTMDTLAAVNGNTDHLTTPLVFDLVAAGVDTLAKLQSAQVLHQTTDGAAGVSPAIVTVDAGAIELGGIF